jgi:hypothetical protein
MRPISAEGISCSLYWLHAQSALQVMLRFSVNGEPGKASHELEVGINSYSDYHLLEGKIRGGEGLLRRCNKYGNRNFVKYKDVKHKRRRKGIGTLKPSKRRLAM